jgi:hypothetical protein
MSRLTLLSTVHGIDPQCMTLGRPTRLETQTLSSSQRAAAEQLSTYQEFERGDHSVKPQPMATPVKQKQLVIGIPDFLVRPEHSATHVAKRYQMVAEELARVRPATPMSLKDLRAWAGDYLMDVAGVEAPSFMFKRNVGSGGQRSLQLNQWCVKNGFLLAEDLHG